MVEVMLTGAFRVSAARAFAFITDPIEWHLFFPGFTGFAGDPRWSAPGDEVTVVARTVGVRRPLQMTLAERIPGERVRFSMRQRGFPEIEHERIFLEAGPSACRVCFVARYRPRAGALALADRLVLRQLLTRGFRSAASALRSRLG